MWRLTHSSSRNGLRLGFLFPSSISGLPFSTQLRNSFAVIWQKPVGFFKACQFGASTFQSSPMKSLKVHRLKGLVPGRRLKQNTQRGSAPKNELYSLQVYFMERGSIMSNVGSYGPKNASDIRKSNLLWSWRRFSTVSRGPIWWKKSDTKSWVTSGSQWPIKGHANGKNFNLKGCISDCTVHCIGLRGFVCCGSTLYCGSTWAYDYSHGNSGVVAP